VTTLRWLPVRVLPVPVTVAYLATLRGPTPVTARDWLLGLAAAVLTGVALWAPLTVAVAQSVLLLAIRDDGAQTAMPVMFLLTMISLGELWIRRSGWPCAVGTGAFAAAQLVLYVPHLDPLLTPVSLVITTAPPVLLGVYIRSVLRVALDADRRREEAVRAERMTIARELHDLVAHHLAAIAVQVGAARHALAGADPGVDEALAQAHATSRAGLGDLKRLMTVLRDPASTGVAVVDADGLPTALAAVVDRTRAAGVTLDADIDPGVTHLDAMRRLAVLRVVQEGLTNVVKHGGPHATLTVRVADDVRITVTDDGPGAKAGRPGFGLVGMRERVELLGGRLTAGRNGDGWALEVTIP
jgi:signal transduction histidine kinase